ncbi:MAG: hypothetical protein AABY37_04120 [Actinomycetota bacterium]
MSSDPFYLKKSPDELQQGDICFAPIIRLEATSPPSSSIWKFLDQASFSFIRESEYEPAVDARIGYTAVMVISHDCQLDKETNARYHKLRKEDSRLSMKEAIKLAEADPELDRFVTVVPIVSISQLRADGDQIKSGDILGYFPVPELKSAGILESGADLNFPSMIDRNLLVDRAASLSDIARGRLRLALARFYAFRTPEIGLEIEAAVGKRITGLRRVPNSPLEIILEVQGGDEFRLILQPENPKKSRPAVRGPSKR